MSMSIQNTGRIGQHVAPEQSVPRAAQLAAQDAVPQAAVKAPTPAQMRAELSEALERLNEHMRKQGRSLSFSMDEQLNRTIVQVKDANTGEVVRQIPDETALKVAHSIEQFKGLLHNEKT